MQEKVNVLWVYDSLQYGLSTATAMGILQIQVQVYHVYGMDTGVHTGIER